MINSFQMFLAAVPEDYWCKLLPNIENYNLSVTDIHTLLPKNSDVKESSKHSKCEMFAVDYESVINSSLDGNFKNFSSFSSDNRTKRIPCQYGYQYDKSVYQSTIVTDWDLVCGNEFHPTLAMVLLSVGEVFGTPVFGYLSDQIGRKKPYLLCFFLQLVFGIATAFSPNFATFSIFRVIVGGTYGAIYSLPFILGLEIVGPDHRATVSVLASITYSIGYIVLGGIAYFVRDWKYLALLTSAPLVFIGFAWLFVPESPRWLLAKGRTAEARDFFKKASKLNGVELDAETLDRFVASGKAKETVSGRFYLRHSLC